MKRSRIWSFCRMASLGVAVAAAAPAVPPSSNDSAANPDSDYDGRTDAQERADGTDPANPESVLPVRLSYWKFERPDWRGEQGQLPLAYTNVHRVASFDGTALALDGSNQVAWLRYRDVEVDGAANLNLRNGAIRFWFRPEWRWYDTPGRWQRLVEIGSWKLSVHPSGNRLVFQTQDPAGNALTNLQVRVDLNQQADMFDPGIRWHELVLNYTPFLSSLIVDGEVRLDLATSNVFGRGVSAWPSAAVRADGFTLGSAPDGTLTFLGALDELETFNHPLTPPEIQAYRGKATLTAATRLTPAEIQLHWFYDYGLRRSRMGDGNPIFRRAIDALNWHDEAGWRRLATVTNALSFSDRTAQPATHYEYRVGEAELLNERFLQGGIDLPPVENRGKVILLVAANVAAPLATEIARLKQDLAGDGWEVIAREAPVHDDGAWTRNAKGIPALKSWIVSTYAAHSNTVKAVFILGHVLIPYSGSQPEDNHPDNGGAWPADSYYGDVDGVYTDVKELTPASPEPWRNIAGDGKFDQDTFPPNRAGVRGLEMAVGRVDFARLPAFGQGREVELLRQYLAKDHRYRHKEIRVPARVVVGTYFGEATHPYGRCLHYNALRAASALFGVDADHVRFGDMLQPTNACLIGVQGGYGGHDALNNSVEFNRYFGCVRFTTADFANAAREPAVILYVLAGSWFLNWNLENNVWRAALGTPQYGLAALCGYGVNWRFDVLGLGLPLSEAMVKTSHGTAGHFSEEPISYNSIRVLAMLGDPTLRFILTAPVRDLRAERQGGGRVALRWEPSPAYEPLYHVYRSVAGVAGPFQRLTDTALRAASFVDASAPAGLKTYQVRTLERVVSPSGSFTNLSQGVFLETR